MSTPAIATIRPTSAPVCGRSDEAVGGLDGVVVVEPVLVLELEMAVVDEVEVVVVELVDTNVTVAVAVASPVVAPQLVLALTSTVLTWSVPGGPLNERVIDRVHVAPAWRVDPTGHDPAADRSP